MTQLSRIIMANALGIISVLGLETKVSAQGSLVDNEWRIAGRDFSSENISPIAEEKITDLEITGVKKIKIANRSKGNYRGNWAEGVEKFLEKLDLSSSQKRQIKAIYRRYYQGNQYYREQLKQAREEMGRLLTSEANSYRIRQKHRQIQSLSQKLGDNRFEALLEVRAVLTPRQREEIGSMIANYGHHRSYHHHHHKKSD